MSDLPTTMRALVAPKFCRPSEYEVIDMPLPTITNPDDILIRVHAAGLQAGDTQRARGASRILPGKMKMPMKIGIEGSGVVVAVGPSVTTFQPGDEVYGAAQPGRPIDLFADTGFACQYALCPASCVLRKPPHLSHADAASLPGFTLTAYQCAETADRLLRAQGRAEGLRGATAFVPGALSGTGAIAIQLLKRHYGVARVISSVSTAKMALVERYLPDGLVDQLVDYQATRRLTDAIPAGSVDVVLNTQWDLAGTFALADPRAGVVVSISSVPRPELLREMMPAAPFWVFWALAVAQWYYAFRLRGTNIKYTFVSGNFGIREDVERTGEFIAAGTVKAVNRIVALEDIEAVRQGCEQVYTSKGGIGKLVITIP